MDQFSYPKFKAFDDNGNPLVGGKLYTYEPGTTTDKDCYTSAAGTTPLSNPVILDSNGEALIYTDGLYDLILTDADDVTLWTMSSVGGSAVTAAGGGSSTVANEITVFSGTDATSIIGGANLIAKSGGIQLNGNVLLSGGAANTLHIENTAASAYADVIMKNLTVGTVTAVGAVGITGATTITGAAAVTGAITSTTDITAHRYFLLGTGHPIITAGIAGASLDSTSAVQVRNAANSDYADFYCRNLIQSGTVTGLSKLLVVNGTTDPLYGGSPVTTKTTGGLTTSVAKLMSGSGIAATFGLYYVTVTGVTLTTGGLVFLNSFNATAAGSAQSLPTGASPYVFNGTLIYTYTDPVAPANIWRCYQSYPSGSGSTPVITDLQANSVTFQCKCMARQFWFKSTNTGSTWLYIGVDGTNPAAVFDAAQPLTLMGADASWISVYIQS